MPTKNPRINVVLEKPLYDVIEISAKREGVSLSLKVRDLLREAIEIEEDLYLAYLAKAREDSLNTKGALNHREVW